MRAWSASGRSLSIATHVARVSHSYLLASYAPLHNIRYGIVLECYAVRKRFHLFSETSIILFRMSLR